jgi:hypothetical protein
MRSGGHGIGSSKPLEIIEMHVLSPWLYTQPGCSSHGFEWSGVANGVSAAHVSTQDCPSFFVV